MLLALALAATRFQPPADHVEMSFAFFGCNRLDKGDTDSQAAANPSSANLPQLERTYADLAALEPAPRYVFGGGDLVNNYVDDAGEALKRQLDGWAARTKASALFARSTIVPIPGNHELNKKVGDDRMQNPATLDVWRSWYSASGFVQPAANGPTEATGKADRVLGDQSTLSYSFTELGVHFVVLNTDTLTDLDDPKTGRKRIAWIPAEWARRDLEAAQADPKVNSIFILGHRNLIDPESVKGDAPIDAEAGAKLQAAIEANSKVRAYVCAHVHAYDLRKFEGATNQWQVISGNGGSSLEKGWKPAEGTFFGFVVIDVYASGKVVLRNFKRPTPAAPLKYFEGSPEPAKPTETVLFNPVVNGLVNQRR